MGLTFHPKSDEAEDEPESETSDIDDIVRPPDSFVKDEDEEEKLLDDDSSDNSDKEEQTTCEKEKTKTDGESAEDGPESAKEFPNVKEGEQTSFPYIDRKNEQEEAKA